jgi:dipeptidyl-peptidase III
MKFGSAVLLSCLVCSAAAASEQGTPGPADGLLARVGDTAFLKVGSDSFHSLSPPQQALAYWLSQAAIAVDPIIYDQLSGFGLRQKRVLEEVLAHPAGIAAAPLKSLTAYTELFWANRGNHNLTTAQKFLPEFSYEDLRTAALAAQRAGAFRSAYGDLPALATPASLEAELQALRPAFFDPKFEPMNTAKSPEAGKDIVQASANTFYPGLTLAELSSFHDQHPLNSRVVKDNQGHLQEQVYRAGTPDGKVAPGLYALYLRKAIDCLQKAQQYAEPPQAQVISDLVRYFETGAPQDWLTFDASWVRNDAPVDFSNGFVEVYRDARGAKGSMAAFVSVTDVPLSTSMHKLAAEAAYFEQKAPWDAKYKKQSFAPPVIKAIETLIETGDFEVNTVGDNLPNENMIKERYGTKNFLFTSSSRALNRFSLGPAVTREFAASPEAIARAEKYAEKAQEMLVALHEVIGHGSGKLSERYKAGSESALKEYFSTLEEARADLMALWNIWDPKLAQLGLVSDQQEVAKEMYDLEAGMSLRQLRTVPKGDQLEEDHARDRQLIGHYIMDKTGGIRQFRRDGRTFIEVTDYDKMRQGVGMLLAELMRIKAEGDYEAIKALVNKYGVHFDPAVRDEVIARYDRLNLPRYYAGVYASLSAEPDAAGHISAVHFSYPEGPVQQYLRFAAMYDPGLAPARRQADAGLPRGNLAPLYALRVRDRAGAPR